MGTWFIRALVEVFLKYARNRDVESLIKVVSTCIEGALPPLRPSLVCCGSTPTCLINQVD